MRGNIKIGNERLGVLAHAYDADPSATVTFASKLRHIKYCHIQKWKG